MDRHEEEEEKKKRVKPGFQDDLVPKGTKSNGF
jgi:hypothetical protein